MTIAGLVVAALLSSFVPGPHEDVTIIREHCPRDPATSCTWAGGPIYWAPGDDTGILLHELGHHFDYDDMTDQDRADFEAINGDPRPWRSPPNSPNEQFAEAYRMCAEIRVLKWKHDRWGSLWLPTGAYGWEPGPKRHKKACAIIRRAASR